MDDSKAFCGLGKRQVIFFKTKSTGLWRGMHSDPRGAASWARVLQSLEDTSWLPTLLQRGGRLLSCPRNYPFIRLIPSIFYFAG